MADKKQRPLIAVPARFSASASALRYQAEVGARALMSAVYAAGGEPLLVHPHAPGASVTADEVASRLHWADGVLLPGGGDISARWYADEPHPSLYDVDEEQDAFDLAVARWALDTGVPLLSVCRGTQVVNVAHGGTLVQHMDERDGAVGHHRNHIHHVSVDAGSQLHAIVGDAVEVSCYHHQCIAEPGKGLAVTARSEEGVIEAVEVPGAAGWYLGVQWHPEDTYLDRPQQLAVFQGLVEAAR